MYASRDIMGVTDTIRSLNQPEGANSMRVPVQEAAKSSVLSKEVSYELNYNTSLRVNM